MFRFYDKDPRTTMGFLGEGSSVVGGQRFGIPVWGSKSLTGFRYASSDP